MKKELNNERLDKDDSLNLEEAFASLARNLHDISGGSTLTKIK